MRFRSSGKRCRLLMSHMNPLNLFLCPNGVGDAVQRVARNTVNPLNTRLGQHIHQQLRYFLLSHHPGPLLILYEANDAFAEAFAASNSFLAGDFLLRRHPGEYSLPIGMGASLAGVITQMVNNTSAAAQGKASLRR